MAENTPATTAPAVTAEPTEPGAGTGGSHGPKVKVARQGNWKELTAKYGLLVAFIGTFIIFAVLKPHTFPTGNNIKSMLRPNRGQELRLV